MKGENKKMKYSIYIDNLSKKYGKLTALNDITLGIEKGEFFGLIGPNGAGKTTLIMLVLGIIKPSKGVIKVNGVNPISEFSKISKKIGVILDYHALYDELSPLENLELYSQITYGFKNTNKIKELLSFVDLWERKDDRIREFSKGMKQRVAIAGAIICNPSILIMDEPLNGLDPESHKMITDLLIEVNKERQMTIFLTSHNLHDVERLCSKVAIIKNGYIIKHDYVSNLKKAHSKKIFLINLLEKNSQVKTEQKIRKNEYLKKMYWKDNNNFIIELKDKVYLNSFIQELLNKQIHINEIKEVNNTLEDVYLEIIQNEVG
ncbi:MAG: ABC transporter ATP-binding protein [Halanaerobiales bacterium]|nr:ABC transporter ATP-binding protein [Halanaerobiales bacterium]